MRFGLVGTGFWARTVHGAALRSHPGVDFAGVWGRDPDKTTAAADELGTRAFDDVDRLLDEVDAVAFAVPPEIQAALAARAARRGRHLLLDKPIGLDLVQADALVAAVDEAGVRSVVFFTNRFVPSVVAWLERAGGDWLSASVRMQGSIFEPGNPFGASPWRREYGPLWDIGPHAFSLILPMVGPVDRVVAEQAADGAVELVVHHERGTVSVLSLSLTAPPGAQGEEFRFYGATERTELPEWNATPLEAMGHCLDALVSPDETGSHPCDVHFGRDVVAVLAAAQAFLDRDPAERAEQVLGPV